MILIRMIRAQPSVVRRARHFPCPKTNARKPNCTAGEVGGPSSSHTPVVAPVPASHGPTHGRGEGGSTARGYTKRMTIPTRSEASLPPTPVPPAMTLALGWSPAGTAPASTTGGRHRPGNRARAADVAETTERQIKTPRNGGKRKRERTSNPQSCTGSP